MTPSPPSPIEGPSFTLSTVRLLLIPALCCVVVGGGWAVATAMLGRGQSEAIAALLAGAGTAMAAIISMLLVRPWRPLPATRWPFVFLLGTMLFMAGTLGAGFLLYFALSVGAVGLWLCLVVSFWAGLSGLVRVFGSQMKRCAPGGGVSTASEHEVSTESSE